MHLADAFIQSDLQYIQVILFFVSMRFLGSIYLINMFRVHSGLGLLPDIIKGIYLWTPALNPAAVDWGHHQLTANVNIVESLWLLIQAATNIRKLCFQPIVV